MAEKGLPLPKFGEWDVNDPASAEGFTVIFNKARNEKRTGGKADSPPKNDSTFKHKTTLGKPQSLIECFDRSRKRKGGFAVCNLLLQNPEGTKENYSSSLATGLFQKTGAAVKL